MKPSEALTAISMVGDLVVRLDQRTHNVRGAYIAILEDIDNDPAQLAECGERAAVILEEENSGFAATMPPAPKLRADGQPRQKPGRKPKAQGNEDRMHQGELPEVDVRMPVDQGKNPTETAGSRRATKPHVAPITSPLTAELRAKLEATLSRGPMTLEALTRMSWAADVKDVEGLLCEDPETFIRWDSTANSQRTPIEVWGLIEHFDRVVGMLTLQCAKSERGKVTAEALGCSVYQALGAWKRLDPEAP